MQPAPQNGPFLRTSRGGRTSWIIALVAAAAIVGLATSNSTQSPRAARTRPAPRPARSASAPTPATPAAPDAAPETFRIVGTLPAGWHVISGAVISNDETFETIMVTPVSWQSPAQVLADDRARSHTYGWSQSAPIVGHALGRMAQLVTIRRSGSTELRWYVPDGAGGTVLVSTQGGSAQARKIVNALRMPN
jgi:hypothetical protein